MIVGLMDYPHTRYLNINVKVVLLGTGTLSILGTSMIFQLESDNPTTLGALPKLAAGHDTADSRVQQCRHWQRDPGHCAGADVRGFPLLDPIIGKFTLYTTPSLPMATAMAVWPGFSGSLPNAVR